MVTGGRTHTRETAAAITAIGVAAPSLRLPLGSIAEAWGKPTGRAGQVAVCRSDEDTLTLGATAADRALSAGQLRPDEVDGLWWGTTKAPFAEGPSWANLAATLRLPTTCDGALFTGSPHCGMDALLAAVDAVRSGRVETALVVTSDALIPARGSSHEASAGAGAAAAVIQREGPAQITKVSSRWEPVLDRYRGADEAETRDPYDGRLFRDEVFLPLCTDSGEHLESPAGTRWSVSDPDGRLGSTLTRALAAKGVAQESPASLGTRKELGDTASAAALLGAGSAMETPGPIALLAYGGGRATSILLEVAEAVPGSDGISVALSHGSQATYAQALRARRQLTPTGESVEMAVPPGSAMFVRDQRDVLALSGARCVECGTVNLPPSAHPSCPGCGGDKFDVSPLPKSGTVQTFVINQTMPAPFEAPLPLVVVDLTDGSRIQLQGADDGAELAVGSQVELVRRRYTIERGVPIYGWKVKTIAGNEASEPKGEPT